MIIMKVNLKPNFNKICILKMGMEFISFLMVIYMRVSLKMISYMEMGGIGGKVWHMGSKGNLIMEK